jgi:hypothetical protein
MMTYEASEQLVLSNITMGSTWEFYGGDEARGEFFWLVTGDSTFRDDIQMWRVGPRGACHVCTSVSESEVYAMLRLLAKHKNRTRPYTDEEQSARLDAEIGALKEMGL